MTERNLYSFLNELSDNYESATKQIPLFMIYQGGEVISISHRQFMEDISRLQPYYAHMREKRIGIAAPNSYSWLINAIAILLAEKHLILFDANLNDNDFNNLLSYSDTEALVTSDEPFHQMNFIPEYISVYSFPSPEKSGLSAENYAQTNFCSSEEISFMCFTSGTSKSSKGVVITVESLIKMTQLAAGNLPGNSGERYFIPLPLYHIYAFTSIFHVMMHGGIICLGTSPRTFKQEIEAFDPHTALLVPSMLQFLLDRKISPLSLSCVITGGSACRPELSQRAISQGFHYYNFYGLSETLGWICTSVSEKKVQWLKPFNGIRFFTDENGEVGISLPAHMKEYYKKPEDTKHVLDGDIFWTGDSGMISEDGCVCIQGRLRDTIVLDNGEKIHSEDKDQDLMQIPHVKEAAVFLTEVGLTVAVVADDEVNWNEICRSIDDYNQKFSPIYRIKQYWNRTEALPRTSTGKLKRFSLEEEYKKTFKK